ncbi:uncharacterized protein [Ptychodera flava]|uniref:uncharacterized protein isoform X1 n=1 Tax=Ptychodera flava TaxID=63121 RepID=UPI00396AACAD
MMNELEVVLYGFPNQGRCYNFGVLAHDDEVKQIYNNCKHSGKLPFNRSKVLFVGDTRVGKTSLLRLLTGEKFQIDEPSTEGIERKMYETKDVDSEWKECKASTSDEFERCSSWCTAKIAIKSPTISFQERSTKCDDKCQESMEFIKWPFRKIIKVAAKFFFLGLLLFSFLDNLCPHYGYGLLQLACYICCLIWSGDFMIAYRYGTGAAIMIYVTIMIYLRTNLTLSSSTDTFMNDVFLNVLLSYFQPSSPVYVLTLMTYHWTFYVVGYAVGASYGLGFKNGVAWGLCMLVPARNMTIQLPVWYTNSTDVTSYQVCFPSIFLGMAFGCVLYTYRRKLEAAFTFTKFLPISMVIISFLACISTIQYLSVFFVLGVFIWIGTFSGMTCGRTAGLPLCLGYIHKRLGGMVIGIVIGHLLGLGFPSHDLQTLPLFVYVISVLTQPTADLYMYYKVKQQTIPILHVREAIRQQLRGDKHLATRLSLWDFAGQELYYSTHHIFISTHSVYLMIFSLLDAVKNKEKQLERIVFWLNSICTHTDSQDTAIFVVGTHRNSINSNQRSEVIAYLTEKLDVHRFRDRFVKNPDGLLVFAIENSVPLDEDSHNLQRCILKEIEDMMYVREEFPVPFMNFYKLINERKFQNGGKRAISLYDDVKVLVKHQFLVEEIELRQMLCFFHKAGEIIYQPDDDHLSKYVIFDPNVLVSLMTALITIPPAKLRPRHLANSWDMLDKRGLADTNLISHIAKSVCMSEKLALSLLLAYDLVCQILRESKEDKELYMVPSILPAYETGSPYDSMPRWHFFQNDDDVYYFDFGSFLPDVVFWRLLARCMKSPTVFKSSLKRHIYRDVARFSFDRHITYILQLVHNIPLEQNLIKVTVQKASGAHSKSLLRWLLEQLNIIRRRDFKFMEFTLGLLCPHKTHEEYNNASYLHIVELVNLDGKLYDNPKLELLCEGRRKTITPYPVSTSQLEETEPILPRQLSLTHNTHISDMPPTLYQDICNHLNVDSMIGDWRSLASELGHTAGQVQIYNHKSNPAGEILQQWSRYHHATIKNLLELLQRPSLERYDITGIILEYISQTPEGE